MGKKNIFDAYMKYIASVNRPKGGYITQEERQKARKRNRRKSNKRK